MARKKSDTDTNYETDAEVDAAEDAEANYETKIGDDRVEVEITADHIYLPLDADGNVPATWAEAADTVRVGRGTKLTVPADILEMLGDRVARVA